MILKVDKLHTVALKCNISYFRLFKVKLTLFVPVGAFVKKSV